MPVTAQREGEQRRLGGDHRRAGARQEATRCSPPRRPPSATAKPNDGVLQMVGGDTLEVTYVDDSTLDGKKGVPRTGKVRAVSTGTVGFFLGDHSTPAYIAYPGQPQVRDAARCRPRHVARGRVGHADREVALQGRGHGGRRRRRTCSISSRSRTRRRRSGRSATASP